MSNKRNNLFAPLIKEGLTTLKVRYDKFTDKEYILASKEWDTDIQWSNYNKTFYLTNILTQDGIYLSNKETRELYEKYGLTDYIDELFKLLKKEKFIGFDCFYYDKKDIRFIASLHHYKTAINSKIHPTFTGGLRRHEPDEDEIDVIKDGMNLGRVQTYKNILTNLPLGGGKIMVQAEQADLNDKEELGFLSYAVDRVNFHTGPDMNYPLELTDAMNEFTLNITAGLKNNTVGSSGVTTSWGLTAALREAARIWLNKDLSELSVGIMGLGEVGFSQAEFLLEEGTEVYISDINNDNINRFLDKYPNNDKVHVVDSDKILYLEADVFCPSAIGGILTEEVINELKYKMVFGSANNQLNAVDTEEEIRLARLLKQRGILYQDSWVQNVAGVLSGLESYLKGPDGNKKELYDRVAKICADLTIKNLTEAMEKDITPTENALALVNSKL